MPSGESSSLSFPEAQYDDSEEGAWTSTRGSVRACDVSIEKEWSGSECGWVGDEGMMSESGGGL